MYVHRLLERHVVRLARSFPAVLVTGARQVGKTTLLRYLAERPPGRRGYVSLDEFGPRSLAQDDPELFLQRHPPPVVIDEIQHVPALLDRLKPRLDAPGTPGAYWLTGSQAFPLMKAVSESLAGRIAVVELAGLSLEETSGSTTARAPFRPDRVPRRRAVRPLGLGPIFRRIVQGSLPRFAAPRPPPWEAYYGSYVQTYIERDVRSLLRIANLGAFRRFLRVAAARTGQLLNLSDLSRDIGIAVSTAGEWLHLLEATHQVYLLRPYFENIGKRQIKAPKLYFFDTGLCCYLTGWTSAEAAGAGAMAGALLENFAVVELWKSYRYRGREAPLWFYRDKEGNEVDVLIAEDGRLFPVEVKLAGSPTRRDLHGIEALRRRSSKLGPGALLCLAREPFALSDEVDALPIGVLA
jgi:hypothetical protein